MLKTKRPTGSCRLLQLHNWSHSLHGFLTRTLRHQSLKARILKPGMGPSSQTRVRGSVSGPHATLSLPGQGRSLPFSCLKRDPPASAWNPVKRHLGPRRGCLFSSRPGTAVPCRRQTHNKGPNTLQVDRRTPGPSEVQPPKESQALAKTHGKSLGTGWEWLPGCWTSREGCCIGSDHICQAEERVSRCTHVVIM